MSLACWQTRPSSLETVVEISRLSVPMLTERPWSIIWRTGCLESDSRRDVWRLLVADFDDAERHIVSGIYVSAGGPRFGSRISSWANVCVPDPVGMAFVIACQMDSASPRPRARSCLESGRERIDSGHMVGWKSLFARRSKPTTGRPSYFSSTAARAALGGRAEIHSLAHVP